MSITGKRVLLGICGGIAAYKTPELVRQLVKRGFIVQVVLSGQANHFVAPLSLETVSQRPVLGPEPIAGTGSTMPHIDFAKQADLILIAPATANRMAALAHGFADDLLTSLCLATEKPIMIAPAMNQQMWAHPATQANLATLKGYGYQIIPPAVGSQACGDWGAGRLPELQDIIDTLECCIESNTNKPLAGKHCVINAGPTVEYIDPVRFLSNRSSGKMGYALAKQAKQLGAKVTLISGPVALEVPLGIKVIQVKSALDMLEATMAAVKDADLFISSAAVADFRVAQTHDQKIKKQDGLQDLTLIENPDILKQVTKQYPGCYVVGFAAETNDILVHAAKKLKEKGCQMLVVNDVSRVDIGFESDDNAVTILTAQGLVDSLPKSSKASIAKQLLNKICEEAAWTA